MHFAEESSLHSLSVHLVGNKAKQERLILSNHVLPLSDTLKELLSEYFLKPFKTDEYYHLSHPSNIELNEVYSYVSAIFKDLSQLHIQSKHLAKHLFSVSNHSNIKGGEFYVAYFKNVIVEGESVQCIGLFKSEHKDVFLQVETENEDIVLHSEEGININKLDKGCLIFNKEKDNGYIVSVVDNTNKQEEAHYWIDDFLQVTQREDNYFKTENTLTMYRNFVTEQLPVEFEMNKADQADLFNRSLHFFREKELFKAEEFQNEVLKHDEVIESFRDYKRYYQKDYKLTLPDEFDINNTALKKQKRYFKSVIKLDKNFHIYIHGERSKIEQGSDEKGKYYKVYYSEEM